MDLSVGDVVWIIASAFKIRSMFWPTSVARKLPHEKHLRVETRKGMKTYLKGKRQGADPDLIKKYPFISSISAPLLYYPDCILSSTALP